MNGYPLGMVQARLADLVLRVERTGARVAVLHGGRPAAVLVAHDDLARLEETVAVLSSPDTIAALHRARADVAAGRVLVAEEISRPREH